MHKTVVLIGFPAAGKTSVGRELQERYGWSWVDVDDAVERKDGRAIARIIREDGEQQFRTLERNAFVEALQAKARVVSIGGGALMNVDTHSELVRGTRDGSLLAVCLCVSPQTAAKRICEEVQRSGPTRPLLAAAADNAGAPDLPTMVERVRNLMKKRESLYQFAEHRVATDNASVEEVVAEVMRLVGGEQK
ncbi:MAG: hypothetical protein KDD69_13520 [Bdellovibrionales bacterium]|nr:hypothetical protein [Bdellovibrionales bacterium]